MLRPPTRRQGWHPGKSARAFRTISEAAAEIDVEPYVLRFWERKFEQISPLKRNSRRYYRPEDIELLRQIRGLLYDEGLTIRGVQRLLHNATGAQAKHPEDKAAPGPRHIDAEPATAAGRKLPSSVPADRRPEIERTLRELQRALVLLRKVMRPS